MMKKVLMICYYFPPLATSGVARSLEFAKLLPQFGWDPLILTVRNSRDPWVVSGRGEVPKGIRVERTLEWNLAGLVDFLHACCSRIARIFGKNLSSNLFREYLCIPDSQIAWFSTGSARRLARECDVIYVSCTPFSSGISGAIVKRLTGRPLVVDFRDVWFLNPHARPGGLRSMIVSRLERFVLGNCDALIVNTNDAAQLYANGYPKHVEKIITIPNGYDVLGTVERNPGNGDFQIMHFGSFYGLRQPDELLECLAEMNRDDIEFVQVGNRFESYGRFKDRVRIRIVARVAREDALRLMHQASLLYVKQVASEYIAVAAKTYEYLATGIPILAEVPPGDNAELVRKYASAAFVVTSNVRADLRDAVERAYHSRARHARAIHPEFEKKYSRQELARQLASLLDRVTVGSGSSLAAAPRNVPE